MNICIVVGFVNCKMGPYLWCIKNAKYSNNVPLLGFMVAVYLKMAESIAVWVWFSQY